MDEYLAFLHQHFSDVETFCQFPDVGYFITQGMRKVPAVHAGCSDDRSRYIIAVCSNIKMNHKFRPEQLTCFSDSMYYGLYSNIHHLECSLVETKNEADSFQQNLEKDINEQKKYISHLENDVAMQNEELNRLNLEREKKTQYIRHLEKDTDELKKYAHHMEHDIKQQAEYICHLENDINELKGYSQHLEHDLKEQTEYICHLENDVGTLKEHLRRTGDKHNV